MEPEHPEVRYTAFLSYSHMDAAAGARLHRRLEAYRLPRRLVGTEGARGVVPGSLWPVFRDREELPAATDLSETVREALDRSGALVVLCSPHSAGSLWVAEEIETFRRLHPDRPVLAAILDGEPADCLPAVLRTCDPDGTRHEPLATDLRRGKDGAHLGLLKLVAGIAGVGLDDLVQRDAARRVRRVTAVMAAAVIAMLVMAALAVVAARARGEAERQRAEAEGLVEFMLTELRTRLKGVGRIEILNIANQRALEYYDRQLANGGQGADLAMRARVLHAVGEDEMTRGDMPRALSHFQEAYRTTAALVAQFPSDPARVYAHGQSEYWVGYYAYHHRDYAAARQAWIRYRDLTDRLLRIDAANIRSLREASFARGNICTIDMVPPVDASGALQNCAQALQLMERVQQRQSSDPQIRVDLANRHAWLAMTLIANQRWDEAEQHRNRHDALVQALIDADPSNLDYRDILMESQFGFGDLLARAGRHAEARRLFEKAATIAHDLSARDPDNASWSGWERRIAQRMQQGR